MDTVLERIDYVPRKLPPLVYYAAGACVMLVLELTNGATLEFSALMALFTFVSGVAIEAFGGLKSLFGLCAAMFAIQHVLYSQIVKALLRQPPDVRLEVPLITMSVYCVGMLSFAAGAYLSRYFRIAGGKSIYPIITDPRFMRNLAIAATVFAAMRSGIVTIFNYDTSMSGLTTSGFVGPLRQLGFLDALAVATATAAIIMATNGRRSIGALNIVPLAIPILAGFLGTYRAGTGGAVLSYIVTCWAFGFRFRISHFVGGAVFAYVFFMILSPYSLAARSVARTPDFMRNLQRSLYILGDVIVNPGKYHEDTSVAEDKVPHSFKLMRYYTFPSGNLERFALLKPDDAIIAATVYRGTMGWRTILPGFEMVLPSFLYPDKPVLGTANLLAHRTVGLVNKDDVVTQSTVTSFADAFSSFEWIGIAIIPAIVAFGYVFLYGLVVPVNLRNNAIAISLIPTFAVNFSEGTLQVQVITIIQGSILTAMGLAVPYFAVRLLDATHLQRLRNRRLSEEAAQPSQG